MEKVIVVIGPTSVGKTKMGVELAKAFHGEVISGDSMQIYKGMDIGTAKVTVEEMEGIVHHCIDIKEATDSFSVKDFQVIVREKITEITKRGKLPIIVGGTGLYIKGALYDYEFQEETHKRCDFREKFEHYTNEELFAYLESVDLKSAQELHKNNRQRVLRAIEIFEETGQRKSDMIEQQEHVCLYDAYFVGLTLERDVLYDRINHRVDLMKEAGLEEEVEQLIQQGLTREHQSMKAIGYKEWFDLYEGLANIDVVYDRIKQHSRKYAKRQYTWFKNQFEVEWYTVNLDDFNETVENVKDNIKRTMKL